MFPQNQDSNSSSAPESGHPGSKRWFWAILFLVIIAGVFVYSKMQVVKIAPKQDDIKLANAEIIKQLPEGLPVEADNGKFFSYSTTTGQSQLTYAAIFNSSKTIEENYDQFKSYCTRFGWTISDVKETIKFYKTLVCRKESQILAVKFRFPTSVVFSDSPEMQGKPLPLSGSSVYINFAK